MSFKSIITARDLDPRKTLGGVGNYYTFINGSLSTDVSIQYIGTRYNDNKFILIRLTKDYYSLLLKLKYNDVLIVNPSLNRNCIFRDGISSLLARRKKKKLIVFFRGWDPKIEAEIDESPFLFKWFKSTFLKADHIIVLSSEFKSKLIEWGYERKVSLESTLVDYNLVNGESWSSIFRSRENTGQPHLLYLGNVAKQKGIWEIVEAYKYLSENNTQYIHLTIAGDGKERESLEHFSQNNGLKIHIPGYLRDKQKAEAYRNAHIYVLASYHEGMPNAVLEAMAFGLPVITSRVGGLPDFFEDGKMGLFLENRAPKHIAEKIQYLLDRPELMKQMSEYNYNYAKEHFYASKVAARLEKIIENVVEGKSVETEWWNSTIEKINV